MVQRIRAYAALTKPRALLMIVITTGVSYLIAATSAIDWAHLLRTLVGVGAAAAGSLALNQYMERHFDGQMERTRVRPLPSGRLAPAEALIFGLILMMGGYAYLWWRINPACSIATMVCGLSYLLMYTPLKRRTSFSSFIGAVPGGMLPIMGWVAVRNTLEVGAWILFVILFLWQIPHALIISIRHQSDYARVGMRQLPLVANAATCRRQMVLNILVMIPVSILPAFVNMTENVYPFVALALGFWIFYRVLAYAFTAREGDSIKLFISLSIYLPALLLAMFLDKAGFSILSI